MAITFLQAKKRQRYLLLILVLIVFAILIIVWQGFLKGKEAPVTPVASLLAPEKITIDWQILEDPRVAALQTFEQILPFEDKVGRENPFILY